MIYLVRIYLLGALPNLSRLVQRGDWRLDVVGVAAAVANAIFNATGVRVRDYPITLEKLLDGLPEIA